jgi:hypothetical protein
VRRRAQSGPQCSPQQFGEPAGNGQPESTAAVLACIGVINLGESFEDGIQFGFWDADSGVLDAELEPGFPLGQSKQFGPDAHRAGDRELEGVAHQIDEDLPQAGRVRPQALGDSRLDREGQVQTLLVGRVFEAHQQVVEKLRKVEGLRLQLKLARLDPGQVQEVVDELKQDLAGNRAKRFFTDNRVLVRGARHGLGEIAEGLPDQVGRGDFMGVADLSEKASSGGEFLVQTYARDTGAIITVLTIPLYACGQRYGASLLGWSADN